MAAPLIVTFRRPWQGLRKFAIWLQFKVRSKDANWFQCSARVRVLFVHVNAYKAFQSLPYGFSSKFRSKDANWFQRSLALWLALFVDGTRTHTYTWPWHLWIVAVVATQRIARLRLQSEPGSSATIRALLPSEDEMETSERYVCV